MSNITTPLLAPKDVAAILGIPVRTLGQWRYLGRGPRYVPAGKHVGYDPADVQAWIESQKRGGPDAVA